MMYLALASLQFRPLHLILTLAHPLHLILTLTHSTLS